MSKHTPGPWIVSEHDGTPYVRAEGSNVSIWYVIGDAEYMDVAMMCYPSYADAARIVECVNAMEGVTDPGGFMASSARLIRKAENARNVILANAYLFAEDEVRDEGPDSEDLAVGVANGLTEAIEALQGTHTERDKMVTALVSAARWLLDDMEDAGEARSEDGVEYDSCEALRLALEALEWGAS